MCTSAPRTSQPPSPLKIGILLVVLASSTPRAQITADLATDPARALIVYDDARNFARVLTLLDGGGDPVTLLQTEYFDRASPGLRAYIKELALTPESLAAALRRKPAEYASLSDLPDRPAALDKAIRQKYGELKALVPAAVFLAVYYVVGEGRNYSEASEHGIYVSVENFNAEHLVPLVVHEQVHLQQAADPSRATGRPRIAASRGGKPPWWRPAGLPRLRVEQISAGVRARAGAPPP